MIGVYFSGTGNSKYCIEKFLQEYDTGAAAFSIENEELLREIGQHEEIVFAYPVQYSNIPKIVKDFIVHHQKVWKEKRIFIIATMGLFSGDGAGIMARLLEKYGAHIIGGLHLKMPDSIGDEKVLKRPLEDNKRLVANAEHKIKAAVLAMQNGKPLQEGIGIFCHVAGLLGQRLYFAGKTRNYTYKLKIDTQQCVGCGKCVVLCPMKNIALRDGVAISDSQCTMCYRCVSNCPKQAITLLGKRVVEQCKIENYL